MANLTPGEGAADTGKVQQAQSDAAIAAVTVGRRAGYETRDMSDLHNCGRSATSAREMPGTPAAVADQ
jgi:hypothetical protein